jgi:hypothetical protein
MHTERVLALKEDLPIIVEVVDREERIVDVLPEIDRLVGGGMVTLERVRVIMYRPTSSPEERAEHESIEVTGSWRVTGGEP